MLRVFELIVGIQLFCFGGISLILSAQSPGETQAISIPVSILLLGVLSSLDAVYNLAER